VVTPFTAATEKVVRIKFIRVLSTTPLTGMERFAGRGIAGKELSIAQAIHLRDAERQIEGRQRRDSVSFS